MKDNGMGFQLGKMGLAEKEMVIAGVTHYMIAVFANQTILDTFDFASEEERESFRKTIMADPRAFLTKYIPQDDLDELVMLEADAQTGTIKTGVIKDGDDIREMTQAEYETRNENFSLCDNCSKKANLPTYHPKEKHGIAWDDTGNDPFNRPSLDDLLKDAAKMYLERIGVAGVDQIILTMTDYLAERMDPHPTHEQVVALSEYLHKSMQENEDKPIREYIVTLGLETGMGIRHSKEQAARTTVYNAARMLDDSDYPIFPEDILEWLTQHRHKHNFPFDMFKDGTLICDVSIEYFLFQEELTLFCWELDQKHPGVGAEILAGKKLDPNEMGPNQFFQGGTNPYDSD